MNSNISFIYLDAGGVMATWDGQKTGVAALAKISVEEAIKYMRIYDHKGVIAELSSDQIWENLQKDLHIYYPNINFAKLISDSFKKIDATFEILPLIKNSYRVGLLTNIYTGVIENVLANHFFNIDFDVVIKSCDYKIAKPDPKIYELVTSQAKCAKEKILLVDDSSKNCEAAASYGWNALLFDLNNPQKSAQALREFLDL